MNRIQSALQALLSPLSKQDGRAPTHQEIQRQKDELESFSKSATQRLEEMSVAAGTVSRPLDEMMQQLVEAHELLENVASHLELIDRRAEEFRAELDLHLRTVGVNNISQDGLLPWISEQRLAYVAGPALRPLFEKIAEERRVRLTALAVEVVAYAEKHGLKHRIEGRAAVVKILNSLKP
jgi:hypothetical protein